MSNITNINTKNKSVLGMGIANLLTGNKSLHINNQNDDKDILKILNIPIKNIIVNPNQPRQYFDEEKLEELQNSILENGLLQPILVKETDEPNQFMIIAGERRFRATKNLNIPYIPAIITNYNNEKVFKSAIIENIQRENLNPIEEALSYQNMINIFNYTHDKLAKEIGKSRAHITNLLRLLNLPDIILLEIKNGNISIGHGKILLTAENPIDFINEIIENSISVRELEKKIKLKNNTIKNDIIDKKNNDKDINNKLTNNDDNKIENEITSDAFDFQNITYEMIKQIYNPIMQNINEEKIIEENQTHEINKDEIFTNPDNIIQSTQMFTKNNINNINDNEVHDAEIDQNIESIGEYISNYTNLDFALKIDKNNGSGQIIINYKDSQELENIIKKFFI